MDYKQMVLDNEDLKLTLSMSRHRINNALVSIHARRLLTELLLEEHYQPIGEFHCYPDKMISELTGIDEQDIPAMLHGLEQFGFIEYGWRTDRTGTPNVWIKLRHANMAYR